MTQDEAEAVNERVRYVRKVRAWLAYQDLYQGTIAIGPEQVTGFLVQGDGVLIIRQYDYAESERPRVTQVRFFYLGELEALLAACKSAHREVREIRRSENGKMR